MHKLNMAYTTQLIELIKENSVYDWLNDNQLEVLLRNHYSRNYSKDVQYGLVKRALAANQLIRLRRGLYLLGPRFRRNKINLFALSTHIYGPSYVSLESALSFHRMIPEAVHLTTCLTTNRSRKFNTEFGTLSYQQVAPRIFQDGVIRMEDATNVFMIASPEKALLDYIFFNRKTYATIQDLSRDLRIEPETLVRMRIPELKKLAKLYRRNQVTNFVTMLQRV